MVEFNDNSSKKENNHPLLTTSQTFIEIESMVRKEVEIQLAKEQKILKDSLGIAIKIIGGAIALFLAMFTVFGLSTWADIEKVTTQIVERQTNELIQKKDGNSNVNEILNKLFNRTVINSYLTSYSRDPTKTSEIAYNYWQRIRKWITKENLELQDFSDSLTVLNLQSESRKKSDSNQILSELLNPSKHSTYNWIITQPRKLEAILSIFKHNDLGLSALKLVTLESLDDSIRSKAASYVKEVRYVEGVERLFRDYRKLTWSNTKQNAFISSIALRPDMPELIAEAKRILIEEKMPNKTNLVAELIFVISKSKTWGEYPIDRNDRKNLLRDCLKQAVKNNIFFIYVNPKFVSSERFLPPNSNRIKDVEPFIGLDSRNYGSYRSGLGFFTIDEFNNLEVYWKLLAEAANTGNINLFRRLIIRSGIESIWRIFRNGRPQIEITAGAGAKLVVEENSNKKDLDLQSLKGVYIWAYEKRGHSTIVVNWSKTGGITKRAKLLGFKGNGFSFKLQTQ